MDCSAKLQVILVVDDLVVDRLHFVFFLMLVIGELLP